MLVLFLTGCSNIYPSNFSTETVTVTKPDAYIPTLEPIATEHPNLPSTATSTLIPTHIAIATRTPLPTLSAGDANARVIELLKTNAGCTLPCWWGIMPGFTSTDEVVSIFEPFSSAVTSDAEYGFAVGNGFFSMKPRTSGIRVGIQYLTKDKIVSMIYINTEMANDIYNKIYDDPFYFEIMSAYTLETMLTKYGKPNQIFIRSFSDLAGEFNPTQILLYYPDKGIVAQYFSPNGLLIENDAFILPTCPATSHISLRLFDPNSKLSLSEILRLNDSFAKYKDISEATNMTLDTFYETYKEYDETTLQSDCPAVLKTPEDIWPSEYRNP